MNIMYLDSEPRLCAQSLHDKHLNGVMPKEAVQILSTALRRIGLNIGYKSYNPTGRFVKWVLVSLANYQWLYAYVLACNTEHRHRFGKNHYSFEVLMTLPICPSLPDTPFTEPPMAMQGREHNYYISRCTAQTFANCKPGPCKYCDLNKVDTVASYRAYYKAEKQYNKAGKFIATYTNRNKPVWFPESKEVKR